MNFDAPLDRRGTGAEKWTIPPTVKAFSVAELDFSAPPCVLNAMNARVAHPNFGYSRAIDGLAEALCGWLERRRHWRVSPSDIIWSPSTVTTLIAAIETLTEANARIIVPTPIYPPFLHIVEATGRRLVASEMPKVDGHYQMDVEHIEREAAAGAQLLLLCNPHNPTGSVWTTEALRRLADIADRYRMVVVSDEVHADFVYDGKSQVPFALCAPDDLRVVTAYASSKTFGLTGLGLSATICSHASDQEKLSTYFQSRHLNPFHPVTMEAFRAGWSQADAWTDALVHYVDGNRHVLYDGLASVEGLVPHWPASTFLMWVDARRLQLGDAALGRWFMDNARAVVNTGTQYGLGGNGFVRINFGTQRAHIESFIAALKEGRSS